jgi:hypothetical protein
MPNGPVGRKLQRFKCTSKVARCLRLYFEGRFDRIDAKLQETSQYVQATYSQVLQNTKALEVLSLETADQGEKLRQIASNVEIFHAKLSDEPGTYGWDEDDNGKVSDVELERVLADIEAPPAARAADENAIRLKHKRQANALGQILR